MGLAVNSGIVGTIMGFEPSIVGLSALLMGFDCLLVGSAELPFVTPKTEPCQLSTAFVSQKNTFREGSRLMSTSGICSHLTRCCFRVCNGLPLRVTTHLIINISLFFAVASLGTNVFLYKYVILRKKSARG